VSRLGIIRGQQGPAPPRRHGEASWKGDAARRRDPRSEGAPPPPAAERACPVVEGDCAADGARQGFPPLAASVPDRRDRARLASRCHACERGAHLEAATSGPIRPGPFPMARRCHRHIDHVPLPGSADSQDCRWGPVKPETADLTTHIALHLADPRLPHLGTPWHREPPATAASAGPCRGCWPSVVIEAVKATPPIGRRLPRR